MMRRRIALRLASAGCAASAALVAVLPAPPSGAVAPVEASWWARQTPLSSDAQASAQSSSGAVVVDLAVAPGTPAQLPPPPTVPEPPAPPPTVAPPATVPEAPANPPPPVPVPAGGLYVANSSAGPTGMSAMRFNVADVGQAVLKLAVAGGSTPVTGNIRLCPALSGWLPVENGLWSARPAHDCDRTFVEGKLVDDGAAVEWSIHEGFVEAGTATFDVILMPVVGGATFNVAFDKPSASALTVLTTAVETTTTEFPLPDDGELPPPAEELPDDGFALPDDPDIADQGGTPGNSGSSSGGLPTPASLLKPFTEDRTARVISTLVLVAMALGFYWLSTQQQRSPRLLGALASATGGRVVVTPRVERARGIGRFARPRSTPPSRL